jgi:hypothetical protein
MGMEGRTHRASKSARGFFRILVSLIIPTLLACLFMLEIGLRILGRSPSNMSDGIFEQHNNSYRLKKNITKISRTPVYSCIIHINALGFRDRASGLRTIGPKPYILFLGESLTFGNGLDFEKTFVGRVAELLRGSNTDVVNLAVGGHKLLDQEEWFKDFLQNIPQKPLKVIICYSPLLIDGFDQPYTDIVVKNGYIFNKRNWILPYIRIVLGNSSAAYCFFRDNIRKLQIRVSDYNLMIARQLMEFYAKNNRLAAPEVEARLESSLERLDSEIRETGAEPIYVYLPLSTDFMLGNLIQETGANPDDYDVLFYLKLIQRHCLEHHIRLINVFPQLKELYEKGQVLNFIRDAHYNEEASSVIANVIFNGIYPKDN